MRFIFCVLIFSTYQDIFSKSLCPLPGLVEEAIEMTGATTGVRSEEKKPCKTALQRLLRCILPYLLASDWHSWKESDSLNAVHNSYAVVRLHTELVISANKPCYVTLSSLQFCNDT